MHHKVDAAEMFEQFLADTRADDILSKVAIVRYDEVGEFRGGKFGNLCRSRGSKQEYDDRQPPIQWGSRARARLIDTAAMASRIQAPELFHSAQLPATAPLWAEVSHWACDPLNRIATTAQPGSKSPHEMWHGSPPPLVVLLPFLKPGYWKVKREKMSQTNA